MHIVRREVVMGLLSWFKGRRKKAEAAPVVSVASLFDVTQKTAADTTPVQAPGRTTAPAAPAAAAERATAPVAIAVLEPETAPKVEAPVVERQ
ncbi:hypothetical protein DLJ96_18530, partial [Actinotalea fermentans ATCC 43279 = JCM 9966 = DSM 3133]